MRAFQLFAVVAVSCIWQAAAPAPARASPRLAAPPPGATPTCSDGIQNGEETGVDCGGGCPCTCAGKQDSCEAFYAGYNILGVEGTLGPGIDALPNNNCGTDATFLGSLNGGGNKDAVKCVICHSTDSAKNPYVSITIDTAALDAHIGRYNTETGILERSCGPQGHTGRGDILVGTVGHYGGAGGGGHYAVDCFCNPITYVCPSAIDDIEPLDASTTSTILKFGLHDTVGRPLGNNFVQPQRMEFTITDPAGSAESFFVERSDDSSGWAENPIVDPITSSRITRPTLTLGIADGDRVPRSWDLKWSFADNGLYTISSRITADASDPEWCDLPTKTFRVGPEAVPEASRTNSEVEVGDSHGCAGTKGNALVTLKDQFGNIMVGGVPGYVTATITERGGESGHFDSDVAVSFEGAGVYKVEWEITEAGAAQVNIHLGAQDGTGNSLFKTYDFDVCPGPYLGSCSVTTTLSPTGQNEALLNTAYSAVMTLRDAYGNLFTQDFPESKIEASFTPSSHAEFVGLTTTQTSPGVFEITVTAWADLNINLSLKTMPARLFQTCGAYNIKFENNDPVGAPYAVISIARAPTVREEPEPKKCADSEVSRGTSLLSTEVGAHGSCNFHAHFANEGSALGSYPFLDVSFDTAEVTLGRAFQNGVELTKTCESWTGGCTEHPTLTDSDGIPLLVCGCSTVPQKGLCTYQLNGDIASGADTSVLVECSTVGPSSSFESLVHARGGFSAAGGTSDTTTFSASSTAATNWGVKQEIRGTKFSLAGSAGTTDIATGACHVGSTTLSLDNLRSSPRNQPNDEEDDDDRYANLDSVQFVVDLPSVVTMVNAGANGWTQNNDETYSKTISPNQVKEGKVGGATFEWSVTTNPHATASSGPVSMSFAVAAIIAKNGQESKTASRTLTANAHTLLASQELERVDFSWSKGNTPGDSFKVKHKFAASEFFAFSNINSNAKFPDGLTVSKSNEGKFACGAPPDCVTEDRRGGNPNPASDGSKRFNGRLSKNGDAASLAACEIGEVVYDVAINEEFTDTNLVPGELSRIQAGQALPIELAVLADSSDGSSGSGSTCMVVEVAQGVLSLDLTAIGPVTCGGHITCDNMALNAGQTSTFSVKYEVPISIFDSLTLNVYTPFPLDVQGPLGTAALPVLGHCSVGPLDTLSGKVLGHYSYNTHFSVHENGAGLTLSLPETFVDGASSVIELVCTIQVDLNSQINATSDESGVQQEAELPLGVQQASINRLSKKVVTTGTCSATTARDTHSTRSGVSGMSVDSNPSGTDTTAAYHTIVVLVANEGAGAATNVLVTDTVGDCFERTDDCAVQVVDEATGATLAHSGDLFDGGLTITEVAAYSIAMVTYSVKTTESTGLFTDSCTEQNCLPDPSVTCASQPTSPDADKDLVSFVPEPTVEITLVRPCASGAPVTGTTKGEAVQLLVRANMPLGETKAGKLSVQLSGYSSLEASLGSLNAVEAGTLAPSVQSGGLVVVDIGDLQASTTSSYFELTIDLTATGAITANAELEFHAANLNCPQKATDSVSTTGLSPLLDIVTTVDPPSAPVGSPVEVTIVVRHRTGSNAAAFNSALAHTVSTGMTLDPSSVSFTGPAACTGSVSGAEITYDCTSLALRATATVKYTATIASGGSTTGAATLDWANFEGASCSASAESLQDTEEFYLAVGQPSITLEIESSSLVLTEAEHYGESTADIAPGEALTFLTTATIFPGSTVPDASLSLLIPPGCTHLGHTAVVVGSDMTLSGEIPAGYPGPDGTLVTWDLGTIVDTYQGQSPSKDCKITATVKCRLDASDAMLAQTSKYHPATTKLVWGDASFVAAADGLELVTPSISLSASHSTSAAPGMHTLSVFGDQKHQAGEELTFSVVLTNDVDATGAAYQCVLQGAMHSLLGGQQSQTVPEPIKPGESYTWTFTASPSAGVSAGETLANTFSATCTSSYETGGGNDGISVAATDPDPVLIATPVLTVTEESHCLNGTQPLVTYHVKVCFPRGTTKDYSLEVLQEAPTSRPTRGGAGGLPKWSNIQTLTLASYDADSVTVSPAIAIPGVTFGDVVVAADAPHESQTLTFVVEAKYTSTFNANGVDESVSPATRTTKQLTVTTPPTSPALSVSSTLPAQSGFVQAGDQVSFGFTLTNDGGAADDVEIEFVLDAHYGSITASSPDAVVNGQKVTVAANQLAQGASLTLSFTANVQTSAVWGETLSATASYSYTPSAACSGQPSDVVVALPAQIMKRPTLAVTYTSCSGSDASGADPVPVAENSDINILWTWSLPAGSGALVANFKTDLVGFDNFLGLTYRSPYGSPAVAAGSDENSVATWSGLSLSTAGQLQVEGVFKVKSEDNTAYATWHLASAPTLKATASQSWSSQKVRLSSQFTSDATEGGVGTSILNTLTVSHASGSVDAKVTVTFAGPDLLVADEPTFSGVDATAFGYVKNGDGFTVTATVLSTETLVVTFDSAVKVTAQVGASLPVAVNMVAESTGPDSCGSSYDLGVQSNDFTVLPPSLQSFVADACGNGLQSSVDVHSGETKAVRVVVNLPAGSYRQGINLQLNGALKSSGSTKLVSCSVIQAGATGATTIATPVPPSRMHFGGASLVLESFSLTADDQLVIECDVFAEGAWGSETSVATGSATLGFDSAQSALSHTLPALTPGRAQIAVALSSTPAVVVVGDVMDITATITNTGTVAAQNVRVLYNAPADSTLDGVTGAFATGTLAWSSTQFSGLFSTLAQGASKTFTFQVAVKDEAEPAQSMAHNLKAWLVSEASCSAAEPGLTTTVVQGSASSQVAQITVDLTSATAQCDSGNEVASASGHRQISPGELVRLEYTMQVHGPSSLPDWGTLFVLSPALGAIEGDVTVTASGTHDGTLPSLDTNGVGFVSHAALDVTVVIHFRAGSMPAQGTALFSSTWADYSGVGTSDSFRIVPVVLAVDLSESATRTYTVTVSWPASISNFHVSSLTLEAWTPLAGAKLLDQDGNEGSEEGVLSETFDRVSSDDTLTLDFTVQVPDSWTAEDAQDHDITVLAAIKYATGSGNSCADPFITTVTATPPVIGVSNEDTVVRCHNGTCEVPVVITGPGIRWMPLPSCVVAVIGSDNSTDPATLIALDSTGQLIDAECNPIATITTTRDLLNTPGVNDPSDVISHNPTNDHPPVNTVSRVPPPLQGDCDEPASFWLTRTGSNLETCGGEKRNHVPFDCECLDE